MATSSTTNLNHPLFADPTSHMIEHGTIKNNNSGNTDDQVSTARHPRTDVGDPESTPRSRKIRLEQNRKAAKESRRRKKLMIEELQRSVIFFSRSNGVLKQQNDELSRLLMQAQCQVAAIESGQQTQSNQQQQRSSTSSASVADALPSAASPSLLSDLEQQSEAQAVATQAIFESQGYPPAAARAAAQTMNATPALTDLKTGATMQTMAMFQQAAAVAMQAAMGMNPVTIYSTGVSPMLNSGGNTVSTNPMMSYNATLQNYVMQQQQPPGTAPGHFAFCPQFMMQSPASSWQPLSQNQSAVPPQSQTLSTDVQP